MADIAKSTRLTRTGLQYPIDSQREPPTILRGANGARDQPMEVTVRVDQPIDGSNISLERPVIWWMSAKEHSNERTV